MSEAKANGWVFGPPQDVAVFVGPIVLSLVIVALLNWLYPQGVSAQYFLLLDATFNVNHVFSTFWYTYTSPEKWHRWRVFFIGIPAVFLIANTVLGFAFGGYYLFSFFSHFSIWHFIKQQQAWFFISSSRGAPRDKLTAQLDAMAIHAATWGFVIASQSLEDCRGWFMPGDLVEFPVFLRTPTLCLCGATIGAFYLRHIYLLLRGIPLNRAAHLIMLSALVIWGGARLAPKSMLTFHFVQLHHAIPYFFLGYRYFHQEFSKGATFCLPKISFPALVALIYGINFLIGKWMLGMRSGLGFFWDSPDIFDGEMGVGGFVFWNAVSLTHYTLDGIIWNRKHNPDWTKALGN